MVCARKLTVCHMYDAKTGFVKNPIFFQLLATNIESKYLTFLSTKEPAILLYGALQIGDFLCKVLV